MYSFIEFPRINPASVIPAGAPVLGVEVTVAEQAALCTLGNVDGQHWTRGEQAVELGVGHLGVLRSSWQGRAAIDIATEIPLPPDSTCLATTRADLDSVGAMARLVLRRIAYDQRLRDLEFAGVHAKAYWERVCRIAERDSFRPSTDWAARPLPTPEQPWGEPTTVDSDRELAHVASICSPRLGDAVLPMAGRVATVACWLLWGDPLPPVDGPGTAPIWGDGEVVRRIYEACDVSAEHPYSHAAGWIRAARERVEASRRALTAEVAAGAIEARWTDGRFCSTSELPDGWPESPQIAIVRARHAGVLGFGYCIAPVVVAFDQAIPRKVAICGWPGRDGQTRYLDVPRLRARLELLEQQERQSRGESALPGGSWGGPPGMCCSPQTSGGTRLDDEVIAREALACVL